MIIERNNFLKVLKQVMPGVETGNVILEGADTFIFENGYIHSYNDNISVSILFPITDREGENISGAIKAKDFYELISRLSDDSFKLISKTNEWIIKSGNARAELTLLESSIVGHVKNLLPTEISWIPLPEQFIEGISICRFSSNKSVLAGIFVDKDFIITTDEIRISSYQMKEEIVEPFWITDLASTELLKLGGIKKYFVSKSWVHFLTDEGVIFSCKRLAQEKYPIDKIKQLIASHVKGKEDIGNILPENLMSAIHRAGALSQNIESFDTIRLTFTQDHIEVFSQRPSGKYIEIVEWSKPFEKEFMPISIFVDYVMIENGIKFSNSFYLKEIIHKEKKITRIVFIRKNGMLLISTFDGGEK